MSAVYAVILVIFALAIEIAVVVSGEVDGHAEYDVRAFLSRLEIFEMC